MPPVYIALYNAIHLHIDYPVKLAENRVFGKPPGPRLRYPQAKGMLKDHIKRAAPPFAFASGGAASERLIISA